MANERSYKIVKEVQTGGGTKRIDSVVQAVAGVDAGNRFEGELSEARMPYLASAPKVPMSAKMKFRHDSMVGGTEK